MIGSDGDGSPGLVIGLAGVALLVGLDVQFDDFVDPADPRGWSSGTRSGRSSSAVRLADLPSIGVDHRVADPDRRRRLHTVRRHSSAGTISARAARLGGGSGRGLYGRRVPGDVRAHRRGGPARMTLITYVNPAVAILLGAVVLNEPITVGLDPLGSH